MRYVWLFVIGTVVQAAGIAGYMVVSLRNPMATSGKTIAFAVIMVGVGALVWREMRRGASFGALLGVSGLLAVGYVVAFVVLGTFTFHGLLIGAEMSGRYAMTMLRVGINVFVIYAIGTALLALVRRLSVARPRGDVQE
ncbi:MAG TPA: hypothetical protein VNW46_04105 [Gemmatimonadaceae bacterium]|nr:hypothetical protein [Gemmatimonadaceae bacterium]